MTVCPTCCSPFVRLEQEGLLQNIYVCEDVRCSKYKKRFSVRTDIGHTVQWLPAAAALVSGLLLENDETIT